MINVKTELNISYQFFKIEIFKKRMYNYYIDIMCKWYFGENHRNGVVNKNLKFNTTI